MRIRELTGIKRELEQAGQATVFDDHDIEDFAKTGVVTVHDILPKDVVLALRQVTKQQQDQLLPFTFDVVAPGWKHVQKVTLFREPWYARLLQGLKQHAPELDAAADMAAVTVHKLGRGLLAHGFHAGELLTEYAPTRAVLNFMNPTGSKPAVIPRHADDTPAQTGVNVALAFDAGVDSVRGVFLPPNSLTYYACTDVSQRLGIEPAEHSVVASLPRVSAVFTQFVKP